MSAEIEVLHLEDSPADGKLIARQLRKSGLNCRIRRVDSRPGFCRALEKRVPDLILADFSLADCEGLEVLDIARERCPGVPCLFVSGTIGEERAVTAMKRGAADFLLKDRLFRLGPAVIKALESRRLAAEKAQAEADLVVSEAFNWAVLSSLNAHIAVIDREGVILTVNQAWERFAQHRGDADRTHSGPGSNYLAVCCASGGEAVASAARNGIEAVLAGRSERFVLEYPCHSPGGPRYWFQMSVTPLAAAAGGAVVAHEDVTERKQAELALRRQRDELAARDRITSATWRSLDLEQRLHRMLGETMALFGVEYGAIYLLDEDQLSPGAWNGFLQPPAAPIAPCLDDPVESWNVAAIRFYERLSDVAGLPDYARSAGIDSVIAMALTMLDRGRPQSLGLLELYSRRPGAFSERNMRTLRALGEQLAVAIDHARRYRESEKRLQRLKMLRENERAILNTRSPEAVAQAALAGLQRLVSCQGACLTSIDEKTGEARQAAAAGIMVQPGAVDTLERLPLEDKPFQIEDLGAHAGHCGLQALIDHGLRAWLHVPLKVGKRRVGALDLWRTGSDRFTAEDMEVVCEMADSLSIVIQQSRLNQQVQAGRQRLQVLSRQLMEAQESERRHIARELHDEIGQSLTVLKMGLRNAGRRPGEPQPIQECLSIIDELHGQVRNLALELRPSILDDLGLAAALRWIVDRQARRAGLEGRVLADELDENALSPQLKTACYRVAQEAVTNVIRYARAASLSVELRCRPPELRLSIRDDGAGFDVAAARARAARGGSLGLLSMEERVQLLFGRIEIDSAPGRGTEIRAYLPLGEEPLERRQSARDLPDSQS